MTLILTPLLVHALELPEREIVNHVPSKPTPISIDGRTLYEALRDATEALPVRLLIEQCSPLELTTIHISSTVDADTDALARELHEAYTAAGGTLTFTSTELVRRDHVWTLLQETGCALPLDSVIDFTYDGSDTDEALALWGEALTEVLGEPVLAFDGVADPSVPFVLDEAPSARRALQQILDQAARDDSEFGWFSSRHELNGIWTTMLSTFPVTPAREHGGPDVPLWTYEPTPGSIEVPPPRPEGWPEWAEWPVTDVRSKP